MKKTAADGMVWIDNFHQSRRGCNEVAAVSPPPKNYSILTGSTSISR
jgi:hypothetical protein